MTKDQTIEIIKSYQTKLNEMGVSAKEYSHDHLLPWGCDVLLVNPALGHCAKMLEEMIPFVEENHLDKAFRWLGFIQGILWNNQIFTLDELKDHNRS